jgi:Xaa-Pro aminopeptidase
MIIRDHSAPLRSRLGAAGAGLRHDPGFDLGANNLDAVLITGHENIRYLTGFTGSNGLLLLARGREPLFLTDPRYTIQSAQEVSCQTRTVPRGALVAGAAKVIHRWRARRIGFAKCHVSFALHEKLKELLDVRTELVPVDDFVEKRRMIKDAQELAAIRESVAINSQAFQRSLKEVRAGISESDLATEIEYQMRKLGAEKPSFETIVAYGPRTALPHARPTSGRLGANEIVLVDMGTFRDGYASDMTRTFHLGPTPAKIKRMYRAVLEAQLAAIDSVRPGVKAGAVDRRARTVLKQQGFDRYFTHSTGHGLGLEIHEPPRIGKGDQTALEPGMTITIEPGAYIEGFAGVRIEDTVAVTSSGCEVLTPTSKELLEL